jgi:hypothetical protein
MNSVPKTDAAYYRELTSRNFHFVSPENQRRISELDVLIAGCGSTGGACIEALARLGVKHLRLADNGTYEVTNLNRQHARIDSIGKNKAVFHAEEVRAIQPFAEVTVYSEGLTPENLIAAIQGVDYVFDAVDVTTAAGLAMKLALHDECARRRLPVFTALDIGFRQWGFSFDYRDGRLLPFNGRSAAAREKSHPISALFTLYPLASVPDHALDLIEDLLEGRSSFASQLGATSDLLSSIIVAATLRFVESGDFLPGWSVDLWEMKNGLRPGIGAKIRSRIRFAVQRTRIARGIARNTYGLRHKVAEPTSEIRESA